MQLCRYDDDPSPLRGMSTFGHKLKPCASAYVYVTKLPVYKAARGTYDLG